MIPAADPSVRCCACGEALPVNARTVVMARASGQRVWVLAHDCGTGPLTTVPLGECGRPEGHASTFWHHVWHGFLMRYPVGSVLRFAWRNRNTFDPTPFDD